MHQCQKLLGIDNAEIKILNLQNTINLRMISLKKKIKKLNFFLHYP
jgi:hypothetical protein